MRRILLLGALTILATLAAPNLATASASTCSTHELAASGWSIQSDSFSGTWDFQCGGADQNPWALVYELQRKTSSGWSTPNCDNGLPCSATRPTSGFYAAGVEHSGAFTFNPAVQLDCKDWRIKGVAHFFDGSLSPVFTSLTYHIGGC